MSNRNRLYTLINLGRQQLGWDDALYRSVLATFGATEKGGKISATTMSVAQLEQVLTHLRKHGFKARSSKSNVVDWRVPRIRKIQALWLALADAGAIDNPQESAMLRWCESVAGCKRLQWATTQQLNQCIEGLKSWATRAGVKLRD